MPTGKKLGGRVAGVPNKLTAKVKDNIINVFTQLGGVAAMTKWAQKNPSLFYQMYARLAPTEVKGTGFMAPPLPKEKAESDREFAKKVAFVLAAGAHDLNKQELLKDYKPSGQSH